MMLTPAAAYRVWSRSYDRDLNPLLALEQRILKKNLCITPNDRVLDLATGTGRWLEYVHLQGAWAIGIDICAEMLNIAAQKTIDNGHLVRADLCDLPLADNSMDIVVCSFALSYVDRLQPALIEMARVAQRVIITDLHPRASVAGWRRSFRTSAGTVEISHYNHSREEIERCALVAGLKLLWILEESFGEEELPIFERAGKKSTFAATQSVPAILASGWMKS